MEPNLFVYQLIQDFSFQRWVKGDSDADARHWEQWLKDNPHRQNEVEQARELLNGISFTQQAVSSQQVDAAWDKVLQRTESTPSKSDRAGFQLFRLWRYAAVISLLILLGIGGSKLYTRLNTTTYETPYGVTQKIFLPDGTEVVLNANSKLSFANDWLENPRREVRLEGEAYFIVSPRRELQLDVPFLVRTDNLTVQVLGTQFNVNSRRGQTQVVLDEGKVALDIPESEQKVMVPGEHIIYSSESNKLVRQKVNSDIYTSWRNQRLTLDDTPFVQIISQLEDTYGVTFVLPDETLKSRRISSTGSIAAEDLSTILEALSTLLQIEFQRNSDTIYIHEN